MVTASRLAPLDASFLAVESPTAHMHVGWVAKFSPPGVGRRPSFAELRDHIEERLARAPRYRQRLQTVPMDLTSPVWVDCESFSIERHVVHCGDPQLSSAVEQCMSQPLPQGRPLWQIWIADELADGHIGIVGKAHHCMVDGIAAVELASLLLDPDPHSDSGAFARWRPRPAPRRAALLARGLAAGARSRVEAATRLPLRVMRSPAEVARLAGATRAALEALVDSARPAPHVAALNEPISSLRHLGCVRRPLHDLRRISEALDVTINDVVLAVSAGAMRRYLLERGEPVVPLKAMVPVSVRDGEAAELGNRISFMFVDLPCDEPDPARRLSRLHISTSWRKEEQLPSGAETLLSLAAQAPYRLHGVVSKLVASPRTFNLVVSNIPGPAKPMYMRGCALEEAYPVVPIADHHSLSIGMTSIGETACFGLYADRETLPEVEELAGGLDEELDLLLHAGEERLERARERDAPAALARMPQPALWQ